MNRFQNLNEVQYDLEEDQGFSGDLPSKSMGKTSETQNMIENLLYNDDVFAPRSEDVLDGPEIDINFLRKQKQQKLRLESIAQKNQTRQVPQAHFCPAQWSISHRCFDCAWIAQTGGRHRHPPPPNLSPGLSSSPIVTLQSLSNTRDSGYEPSPTSAFSFTFTSDEEENPEEEESEVSSFTPVLGGITPPINIPTSSRSGIPDNRNSVRPKNQNHLTISTQKTSTIQKVSLKPAAVAISVTPSDKPITRKRCNSAPEFGGNELLLQKTRISLRNGNFFRTPLFDRVTPLHGRNYSLPATTPDGRPLLAPTSLTPSSRASREGLIDLVEEDPEGTAGHKRRVLVLALPDILVDVNRSAPLSPSEESTTSSILSRESSCSSTSSSNSARLYSLPPPIASRDANSGSDTSGVESSPRFRSISRRPRALSCDVTLVVEVGQDLRKIADAFDKKTANVQPSMWRSIRDSLGRRFSLGGTLPIPEIDHQEAAQADRGTQSLPSTPNHGTFKHDSEWF